MIKYVSSTLILSLAQIQIQYSEHSLYVMDYIVKDIPQKCLEIRLNKEEITLTCFFNYKENCISTFLFPDDIKFIDDFVDHLIECSDSEFIKNIFSSDNCFLEVQCIRGLEENMCLVFYQNR